VLPVGLGLGAALCVGIADLTAGIGSRRLSPVLFGFWEQGIAAVLAALLLLLLRPPFLVEQIPWGLAAGLGSGVGLAFLYRAMAVGAISLAAPISACSIVFPIVFAVATGETLAPLAAAGVVAIITGVVLASLQPAPVIGDPTDTGIAGDRRAATLAIVSAVAFGAFFILIDLAPQASGWNSLWTAGAVRLSSFAVQTALALRASRRITSPGRYTPAVVATGILDQGSLVLLIIGAMTDAYSIVTALFGLYPVVTMFLGIAFLGERLTRVQASGATLAIAGVVFVSVCTSREAGGGSALPTSSTTASPPE
jgi:drug/metabolite transporter (DMT)-like permease